jgi:hypothetical protein
MSSYISTSVNRNALQWCFLTFPQSGQVTKQDFCDRMDPLGPYEFQCYVQETHQDGEPHLHALVKFTNKITKSKILAHLKKTYPNDYKRIDAGRIIKKSSPRCAYEYLLKEDTDPLTYGNVPERNDPCRTRLAKYARDLGFESVEALSRHVQDRNRRIDELDTKLLQCIYNIEHYAYVSDLTWQEDLLLQMFEKNYTVKFSGINMDDDDDRLQSIINKFLEPGVEVLTSNGESKVITSPP